MTSKQIDKNLRELAELAEQAARASAEVILPYFGGPLEVQQKADGSPVSVADKKGEECIVEIIKRHRPNDGWVGEEFGSRQGSSGYRWIIDPIDGTIAFVHGVPLFGTLIAVQRDGLTLVGLINMPALGEMVVGIKGNGVSHNGKACRVSEVSELSEATVLTSNCNNLAKHDRLEGFNRLVCQAGEVRTWGDCYGYLLVATGRAEIMIDPVVAIWDIAAMEPIITEAGGRITDLQGQGGCSAENCLATNGLLHDQALAAFADAG